ncbi:urea ABC transporter ATP-binding subunit UrtE [Metabacillus litoralis]|jgi:urea transport system ATP-binding protein|uniref:urea ABC transporter ATP-binding subunit UrtE n=1 Tax=Metabacillus litoralis TaxID=152268 RepID=UPI0020417F75|nr:urea ABC transporter ATP-binding subunit UrtE [Metabacillus litoralis]MCM3650301.1 urea ABC transporter ATP-binding subunit UrtE [Metabacillus litoralis]
MLHVSQLQAGYDETMILRNVHLDISKGKIVGLLGRNGVGKTTLVKVLMGLLPVNGGNVQFQGKDLKKERPEHRARAGISYVPQGREIFSDLSIRENLLLGMEAVRKSERSNTIPEEIFRWFPVLAEMINRKGGDLSGGQQQQLAIARALISNPKLLLLDEPMEGIQPSIVQLIQDVLVQIANEKEIAILLVEHNLDVVLSCAESFYILDKGQMVMSGRCDEINEDDLQKHLSV